MVYVYRLVLDVMKEARPNLEGEEILRRLLVDWPNSRNALRLLDLHIDG